jgi:cytosine/creatinine deaminase
VTTDLPMRIDVLTSATLADGACVDVAIADGRVVAVEPAGVLDIGADDVVLDLAGYLLVTAPAEPHAHLDKSLTFDAIRPPLGDLRLAVESFSAYAAGIDEASVVDRASQSLDRMLAAGTTAVRSHVNFFDGDDPLVAVRAMVAVRERFAGLADIELVALPSWFTPDATIEAALDAGVDLVGGAPHLSPEPLDDLHRLLDIAERRGVGVDLHADEGLDGPVTLLPYAERTRTWPVTKSAGHCVRLGTLEAAELAAVIDEVVAAGIGIISLPITNLYLQGWEHPVSTPRGITALRALIDAGVVVAAGADNLRDPFNPVGRGDALETASLLVTAGHLQLDEAMHLVTDGARQVMGLPAAGPRVGAAAELLAIRADSLGEAIAFASPDRFVLHAGRLVSESHVTTRTATHAQLTRGAIG